ncbi:unnamed protein product [Mytilus coruscus]|uniref:Uncharacterized protein n=1 Tax=Mytilus coruscus TaxID=42192 RepID=A0A6J8D908_MYTCO|nr:unnamed protein product [Mytilus coruscus]
MLDIFNKFKVTRTSLIIEPICANGKFDLQKITPDHSLLTWEITLKLRESNNNAAPPKNNLKTKIKYDIKNLPEDWLSSESAVNDINSIIQNLEISNITQNKINNMYDEFVNVIKTEMSTQLSSTVIVFFDGVNNQRRRCSERQNYIPIEVKLDNGQIYSDKDEVLDKWKCDISNMFNRNHDSDINICENDVDVLYDDMLDCGLSVEEVQEPNYAKCTY